MNAREMREYQLRRRNGSRNYLSEIEDLEVCVAWEAGELTEGQAMKLMGKDRVTARAFKQDGIDRAVARQKETSGR